MNYITNNTTNIATVTSTIDRRMLAMYARRYGIESLWIRSDGVNCTALVSGSIKRMECSNELPFAIAVSYNSKYSYNINFHLHMCINYLTN